MGKTIQIMIDKRGAVTNGDVIKAMFPSLTISKINGDVNLFTGEPILKNVLASIDEVLWNSPYKECDKNDNNKV